MSLYRSSRRALLQQCGSALVGGALLPMFAGKASASGAPRPRSLVQIHLFGGIDAVLFTDPKEKKEVRKNVDLPYGPDLMPSEIAGVRAGPLLPELLGADMIAKAAILNGVEGSAVAHPTGALQVVQMRRGTPVGPIASFGEALGRGLSDPSPLSQVLLDWGAAGRQPQVPYPRGDSMYLLKRNDWKQGTMLSDLIDAASDPKRRAAAAEALEEMAKVSTDARASRITQVAKSLLSEMASPIPKPTRIKRPEKLHPLVQPGFFDMVTGMWEGMTRDTVALLSRRLTTSVHITVTEPDFDSHFENLTYQVRSAHTLGPGLRSFLSAIDQATTVDGTPLRDEVLIMISSELGRFPFVNSWNGKDHLTQFPVILLGAGVRPGQYGQSDDRMVALPISPKTGRPSAEGFVPSIDDLAVTLLSAFGVDDPLSVGYTGRRLPFLFT